MSEQLSIIRVLLPVVPMTLVWLAGAIYAIVSYRRHPRVSGMALAACLLLLLNLVGGTVFQWWLVEQRSAAGWSRSQEALFVGVFTIVRIGVTVGGSTLLLVAVFAWRSPAGRPASLDLEAFEPRTGGESTGIRTMGEEGR